MSNYFSRSKIFLYALIAFCLGIFLGPCLTTVGAGAPTLTINPFIVNLQNIPATIVLLNCYIATLSLFIPKIPKVLKISIILIIAIFLGLWRFQNYLPKINQNHIAFYNDNREEYIVGGAVGTEPEKGDSNLRLQISNVQLTKEAYQGSTLKNSPRLNLGVTGKILVTLPRYYDINYGDKVQFKTKLASPTNFESFDYKNYLARDRKSVV